MESAERAALLGVLEAAQRWGFLGPGPVTTQLDHALAFDPLLPAKDPLDALDLGSGGGVPALVLAVVRPESSWTLVDSAARRTAFLSEAVSELGLQDRVDVLTARAEELPSSWRQRFDVVTARSFGPPAVLAECASPWLRVGGTVIVSEPPGGDPDRWPAEGLEVLGLAFDLLDPGPPTLARLRQVVVCPVRFPRRTGVPLKRPLW
jgi:16S rRNA (guanine527-N7)-methyltransferase